MSQQCGRVQVFLGILVPQTNIENMFDSLIKTYFYECCYVKKWMVPITYLTVEASMFMNDSNNFIQFITHLINYHRLICQLKLKPSLLLRQSSSINWINTSQSQRVSKPRAGALHPLSPLFLPIFTPRGGAAGRR